MAYIASGAATAVVKGGFWEVNGVSSLVSIQGHGGNRSLAAWALHAEELRPLRELMRSLMGAAPGANATKTKGRIVADVELGGRRAIEQQTLVNQNTTAGDVTIIKDTVLDFTNIRTFGANPPPNLDGSPFGR